MKRIQGFEALVLSDGVAFHPLVFSRPRQGSLCLFRRDTVISMMLVGPFLEVILPPCTIAERSSQKPA